MNAHDIRAWERTSYDTPAGRRFRARLRLRVWRDSVGLAAHDGVLCLVSGVLASVATLAGAALLRSWGWL